MGLLISALYNIVDQIFIGNSELGYLGNAATGVSFPVICIANTFAWCVGDDRKAPCATFATPTTPEPAATAAFPVGTGAILTTTPCVWTRPWAQKPAWI